MPRQRWKNHKKLLPKEHKILQQFCENTSIHGLNHIFEDGSLLFERYVYVITLNETL